MPSVFTDVVGTYDLTIADVADWTVSSGGLPNGDNYVTPDGSLSATYNLNGDDFDFADGTAWTVEFWLYFASVWAAGDQTIICCDEVGTQVEAWAVSITSAEQLAFVLRNTTGTPGGHYLSVLSSTLSTATWYYVICEKETGNTVSIRVNDGSPASSSSTTGTVRHPSGASRLYMGTFGDGTQDLGGSSNGIRVSKLAIYNKLLSPTERDDHYLAMTA